jgi:protein-disulfide isomerase
MRGVLCVIVCSVTAVAHADTVTQQAPARASFDPDTIYNIPRGDAPSEGPHEAPITIVDWSDYACGFCNRVQDTLDRLGRLYPGQIRWVHRELPADEDNPIAAEAARAAAAQGRFRPMHDRLFALHGRVDRAGVELIARELGLDMIRFRGDLDAGTYRAAISRDIQDAVHLGITGTPTSFVNGRVVHGNQPLKVFVDVVDQELARADAARAKHPLDLYTALVETGKSTADAPADATNPPFVLDVNHAYRVGLGLPGHQQGPNDALVTIVEWSDFQCPFCAKEAPVLAHVRAKYGDDVRVIYRHMAMLFHPRSAIAAEAGVAAAEQGKFWAFHDQVFAHFGHLTRQDLESYAQAAGLDLAQFRAALDTRRYHDAVIAETAAAEALGVDGTPTMFINGQPIAGAHDEASMDRIIDAHLVQARAAIAHGLQKGDLYPVLMGMASGDDRADPSAVPSDASVGHLELRAEDRSRSVAAACRRHDGARAAKLAGSLTGDPKRRAEAVCTGEGVDLPQ